jgi:exoribonuclease R
MPRVHLDCPPEAEFNAGFDRIRTEFDVIVAFDADALADAGRATATEDRIDRRDLDLITIDPPGSRDLDQAFTARRDGDGYLVSYAIADTGAFVEPSSALDLATRRRGLTFYAPDVNAPLHPDVLSAGAASLLPDSDTPALLWTLRLDSSGRVVDADVERSLVRSRAALSYQQVADDLAGPAPDLRHVLLSEIGPLRQALERERGGVSLNLPSQQVVDVGDHYAIEYRTPLPVEDWNAQISLMTGMAAARRMLDGGIGILRTLAAPDDSTLEWLRRTSNALSVSYPRRLSYPDWVRSLDSASPIHAALQNQAARAFRGAGYVSFDGDLPDDTGHAALATDYTHVTAPLRRLIDRYSNEIVLAICAGRRPEGWALDMLEAIPDLMADASRRNKAFERALVDFAEVMVLSGQVGQRFEAIVTDRRDERVTLQLLDPAVIVRLRNRDLGLGSTVTIELTRVDQTERRLEFVVI